MDFLINIAEHFTGLFQAGADQFTSFVGGMIPLIACLILFVNALIQFIGEDRVFGFMKKMTRFTLLRYTVIPFLACFFLTITGLFPHANSSELFVWLGVSGGFASVGNQSDLAIRFLLTGFVICLIRGIVTEQLAKRFAARRTAEVS